MGKPGRSPRWRTDKPSGRKSGFRGRREELPIPGKPLPLCPHCDYNVTGLTSRVCPECGKSFTVEGARARGFKLSKEGRSVEYRRGARSWRSAAFETFREIGEAVALGLGAAMTFLGFFAPILTASIWPRTGGVLPLGAKIAFKIVIAMTVMIPVDAVIAGVGARRGYGWIGILLVTGVLTVVVSALIGLA